VQWVSDRRLKRPDAFSFKCGEHKESTNGQASQRALHDHPSKPCYTFVWQPCTRRLPDYSTLREVHDRYGSNPSGFPGGATSKVPLSVFADPRV
jgi:hypothetical protein